MAPMPEENSSPEVTLEQTLKRCRPEVIQAAREQCREHLRAGRDFAFNATNITRQARQRWIDLFADYGAQIVIVYIEPSIDSILAQNRRRANSVPEKIILRLLEKLEPPTIAECHILTFG